MRIIGGEFKGRSIDMPKGSGRIRPTSDKVREALFNIISERVANASILDLFAGSGALGIEALSRGGLRANFVDLSKDCTNAIKNNLNKLNIQKDRAVVFKEDALKAIKKLSNSKIRFNLIFLDPPYYGEWVKKCLIYLDKYDILNNSYMIICEHFKKDVVPEGVGRFKRALEKQYGDTVLTFYR